jgi:hypothetical protein
MDAEAVTDNPLVVLFKKSYSAAQLEEGLARGFNCRDSGDAYICSKSRDDDFNRLGVDIKRMDPIPMSIELTAGENASGARFMSQGWSTVEKSPERWGTGSSITWVARLPHPVCREFTFQADVRPLGQGEYFVRMARAFLNDKPIGEIALSNAMQQIVTLSTPLNGACFESFKYELQFDEYPTPKSLGINEDRRPLTWRFKTFSFDGK